jgi:hypothetical protein
LEVRGLLRQLRQDLVASVHNFKVRSFAEALVLYNAKAAPEDLVRLFIGTVPHHSAKPVSCIADTRHDLNGFGGIQTVEASCSAYHNYLKLAMLWFSILHSDRVDELWIRT